MVSTPQTALEVAEAANDSFNTDLKKLPADLENLRSALLADLTVSVNSLLKTALKPVTDSLDSIKETLVSHADTIKTIETSLSAHSDKITELESAYEELLVKNEMLTAKLDDLENRSRRSNLRITGVPERMEGSDPVKFMSLLFQEILGAEVFPHPPVLDRAHRLGRVTDAGGKPSSKPRAFIVCFHYHGDKERILARRREELIFQGHRINIYPDLSASLARQRAAFNAVKSSLYRRKIRFGLRYPARLQVEFNGEILFFNTPKEAQAFYDCHFEDWGG